MSVLEDVINQTKYSKVEFNPVVYLNTMELQGYSSKQIDAFRRGYKLNVDYSWFLDKELDETTIDALCLALNNRDFRLIHSILGRHYIKKNVLTEELLEYIMDSNKTDNYFLRNFVDKNFELPILTAFLSLIEKDKKRVGGVSYLKSVKYGYYARVLLFVFFKEDFSSEIISDLVFALNEGCPLRSVFLGDASDILKVRTLRKAYKEGLTEKIIDFAYEWPGKYLETILYAIEKGFDAERINRILYSGYDEQQFLAIITGIVLGVPESILTHLSWKATKIYAVANAINNGADAYSFDWEHLSEAEIGRISMYKKGK